MRQVTPCGREPMEAWVVSMVSHRPLTVDSSWPARMEPGRRSNSSPDMLVIRADADGDTLWTRLFDTPSSPPPFGSWSFVRFVRATSDGGCIIGGGVASVFVGTGSPFLLKLTADERCPGRITMHSCRSIVSDHCGRRSSCLGDPDRSNVVLHQLGAYYGNWDPAQSSPILPNQPRSTACISSTIIASPFAETTPYSGPMRPVMCYGRRRSSRIPCWVR